MGGGAIANSRYAQQQMYSEDDYEDLDQPVGIIDADEEEGIAKERVNNFSNKNMISAAHMDSGKGSVAKDRGF